MSLPAYLYARFSSVEQAKGHSLERQLQEGKAFIERMGWLHSPSREIADEGRSAYRGANRIEGSGLHEFEEKARAGHFQNGVVLAVENLDRLTRQGYEEAFDLIRLLTTSGVTIATWHDNQVYHAHQRIDMMQVMSVILKAELAHEESDKKSKRLKAYWNKKVAAAQEGEKQRFTGVIPGWLQVNPTTQAIEPNPHRVAILEEVFAWYCDGKGLPWIVRTLNERGEPTWGRGKQAVNKGWSVSTVHKYLTNRTALGEYHPKERQGDKTRISRGVIIPDYYPQVIKPDVFNRVQALRKQRMTWGGKNQFAFPNLFSGIARCLHCGGTMQMQGQIKEGTARATHKGKGGRPRKYVQAKTRSYLRCDNARRSFGCTNKSGIHYESVEHGILHVLFERAMGKHVFAPDQKAAGIVTAIAEQERQIATKGQQLATLTENLMAVFSRAMAQKAADLENEIEADEARLTELRRALTVAQGAAQPEEDLQALVEARLALDSEDEETKHAARVKTHQALKSLIQSMHCDDEKNTHVIIGKGALYMFFDPMGVCQAVEVGTGARMEGPNGELDWHPDDAMQEAAE